MTLLKPMAYQNTYALAVKRSFANEHQLKKISDLAAISDQIKAGFTLEFIDRSDGYKGIQEAYGLNFQVYKAWSQVCVTKQSIMEMSILWMPIPQIASSRSTI